AQRTAPSYGGGRNGYTPTYRPSANKGGGSGSSPAAGQGGGGGGSAPSTQNSGGFNLQDYPNLWNQMQQGHEGPAIDNQGNCVADCYGWTGSN
ncbi:hypothetical protein H3T89_08705, partial [Bifidobacterium sp. W8114]|nr:hypothetical protein [Bifidobacterium asteroides]MBH9984373.1 hypothetical protein [Bifidobacterium asteroides]MBI0100414.1 hypothetical protein [Bifidobacterium sp. W8114]